MLRIAIVDGTQAETEEARRRIDFEKMGLVYIGSAHGAEEGIRLCREAQADIAICGLDEVEGLKFVKGVKDGRGTEVIASTDRRRFEYARELLTIGVTDILVKPYEREETERAIARATSAIRQRDGRDNICRLVSGKDVKNDNFIAKAITYIERNCREKLTLSGVADKLYVSSWHLCKLFKAYTGRHFVDIVNLVRVNRAREYLKSTTLKVNEIARRVGYTDVAYFTVIFSKLTGMSPLKYRNNRDARICMVVDRQDIADLGDYLR